MGHSERSVSAETPTISLDGRAHDWPTEERGASMGRYVVVETIGEGGMGVVVRAYDPKLHREVALKRRRFSPLDARAEARLLREAQAMAQLSHPNVVSVYDVDVTEGGVVVAMELVEGQTLRHWLRTSRPRAVVLDALQAAGEGLAAAHRAGLVHRDFKPANVLVGDDGRVRVTDFGLARGGDFSGFEDDEELDVPLQDRLRSDDSSSSPLATPLTEAGVVMGTPGYMPPEQWAGAEIDARSDQYAFCVTAWQALTGSRPFSAPDHAELRQLQRRGPPVLGRDDSLPRWLGDVLRRGLEPEAPDRWPSMDELLRAMARDPWRRRRRTVVWGAAAIGLGLSAIVVGTRDSGPDCDTGRTELEDVWNDERREAMRRTFDESGAAAAEAAFSRVEAGLDDFVERWARARDDACEDTHVRRQHGQHLLDLRNACLGRRRQSLVGTIEVLLEADSSLVYRAAEAVQRLPLPRECEDIEALLAELPPPEDPDVGAQVTALREQTERVHTLSWAGHVDRATELVDSLLARARSIEYPPLEAELMQRRARLLHQAGEYEDSAAEHRRAFELALRSGHDRVAARAAASMAGLVSWTEIGHAEGGVWSTMALALTERTEVGGRVEAEVLQQLGWFSQHRGTHDLALERFTKARDLWERLDGPEHPQVIDLERSIGVVLDVVGEYEQAEARFRRVLELWREHFGSEHPSVAEAMHDLALALENQGHFAEAETIIRESIELRSRTLGPEHPHTITTHYGLGWILLELDRIPEAVEVFEQTAERVERVLGPSSGWLPRVLDGLAQAYIVSGRPGDARAPLERSLELRRAALGPDDYRVGYALGGLAQVALETGDAEESVELFEEALGIMGTSEARRRERADTLASLADAERAAGRLDDAAAHLEESMALYDALGGPPSRQARNAIVLAELRSSLDPEQARALLHRARRYAAQAPSPDADITAMIDSFAREHPELEGDD